MCVYIENFPTNHLVKDFWKSIHICQNYCQTSRGYTQCTMRWILDRDDTARVTDYGNYLAPLHLPNVSWTVLMSQFHQWVETAAACTPEGQVQGRQTCGLCVDERQERATDGLTTTGIKHTTLSCYTRPVIITVESNDRKQCLTQSDIWLTLSCFSICLEQTSQSNVKQQSPLNRVWTTLYHHFHPTIINDTLSMQTLLYRVRFYACWDSLLIAEYSNKSSTY